MGYEALYDEMATEDEVVECYQELVNTGAAERTVTVAVTRPAREEENDG